MPGTIGGGPRLADLAEGEEGLIRAGALPLAGRGGGGFLPGATTPGLAVRGEPLTRGGTPLTPAALAPAVLVPVAAVALALALAVLALAVLALAVVVALALAVLVAMTEVVLAAAAAATAAAAAAAAAGAVVTFLGVVAGLLKLVEWPSAPSMTFMV